MLFCLALSRDLQPAMVIGGRLPPQTCLMEPAEQVGIRFVWALARSIRAGPYHQTLFPDETLPTFA